MTVDIDGFVSEEVAAALEDITLLSKKDPPLNPLGQIHPKPVAAARGLFFFHTRKVGFLAGIKFGRGWLIERQSADGEQPARWSAPVFYTVHEGSFGFTAGVGTSYTLIALGTQSAVDAFKEGKAVLGEDFSMALSGGADADENNLFDRGWKESIAWSGSGGLLLDASVTGGHIGLDAEHNEALYGHGVAAAQILEGSDAPEPPAAFKPVYDLINSIVARADGDPRKFSGFEKHWAPQNPLGMMPGDAKELMYEREDSMEVPRQALMKPSDADGDSKPTAEDNAAEDAQLLSRKAEQ